MKKKFKTFFYLFLGIAFLTLAGYLIFSLSKNLQVIAFTEKLGIWGPIFLTFAIALSGILVPLTSLPFLLTGLALYDYWTTFIVYYLGNTLIAPVVDFWIARRWGRPAVAKLAGKKSLKKIDDIAKIAGLKSLAILRIFGGILFDLISYAIGLTNMDFKPFFIFTSILPIPGMLLTLYLIHKGLTSNFFYLGIIIVWGYGAAVLTFYLINKRKTPNQLTKSHL